ncbi:MAG: flavodoxin family protein [Pseudomonadota bacterium]
MALPDSQLKKLLIVAHAPSPNTQALVDAVLRGARHEDIDGIEVEHIPPLQAGPDDVLKADAILLGTTENFGYMSGAMKDFFDRTFYSVLEQTEAMPFGVYIRAGLDGTGTRVGIEKITSGMKWKQVQDTVLCHGEWDDAFLEQVEELGMSMAAGLEAGIF